MVGKLYDRNRILVRTGIFMAGPFSALLYSSYPFQSISAYLTLSVSVLWVYLSIDDALHLSVPIKAFGGTCILTCILAISQQNILMEFLINFGILTSIILLLVLIQYLKQQSLVGSADFFAIFSLGMTLKPTLLGPWLLITCVIPLVGLSVKKQSWSSKLPFIPYLTVGWMLIFLLN